MSQSTKTNNQLLLEKCIEEEYKESTGYKTKNDYFEHFAASQVLKNFNLSDEEIDNGNSGGPLDGGCDNLYIFLNDELITTDQTENLNPRRGSYLDFHILQSKYTFSFKEDTIMKWKTTSDNLLNLSNELNKYTKRYNETIIETFTMFKNILEKLIRNQVKVRFFFYYITLGIEIPRNVEEQASELKVIIKEYYPSAEINVNFVTADQLMDMYNTDSEISVNLDLADQPISLSENEYISLVRIGTYFNFITDDNHNLRKSFC